MRAIITGARGQDATLLGRLLLSQGHQVLGTERPDKAVGHSGMRSVCVDLSDRSAVESLIKEYQPDQIYHLAASHHSSEQRGDLTQDREMVGTNFSAAEVLLSAIALIRPTCRLLLAGSSQMYAPTHGGVNTIDEDTPMVPTTFYGQTKAWSRHLLDHYRKQRSVFGTMVILFNHESRLRSPLFLSRKVTMAAARARAGQPGGLRIRDIRAAIDWSSAHDFVEAMRLAIMAATPEDYVVASGIATKVEEVLEIAFGAVGLDWREHTTVESPVGGDRPVLIGNPARARKVLGWSSQTTIRRMIEDMVAFDLSLLGVPVSGTRRPRE